MHKLDGTSRMLLRLERSQLRYIPKIVETNNRQWTGMCMFRTFTGRYCSEKQTPLSKHRVFGSSH